VSAAGPAPRAAVKTSSPPRRPGPFVGLAAACDLIRAHTAPLEAVTLPLSQSLGRVLAQGLPSRVDTPSADVSLKDGYALCTADTAAATPARPVTLRQAGTVAAGQVELAALPVGAAVRILTGARLPSGADGVAPEEVVQTDGCWIRVAAPVPAGQDVLPRGHDLTRSETVLPAGTLLRPGHIGLLAAAGLESIPVVRPPRVALVATGDEVCLPGAALGPGQLYASNLFTQVAWCRRHDLAATLVVSPDEEATLSAHLQSLVRTHDAIVTSGGAWTGDRDLMGRALAGLGWQCRFHRLRLGPGKAAGFGLLHAKPVFILPGGPPANLAAFLLLVLPGLLRMAGQAEPFLPAVTVTLGTALEGRIDWTQVVYGQLVSQGTSTVFQPLTAGSRLRAMAEADALATIPEGVARLEAGTVLTVHLLH
jgi:molybdopterin molybdotransferase